jgi:hypothetical protein
LTLSEQVLRLHAGIRTVLITKKEDAEWKMVEEAIRPGVKLLEDTREQARSQLAIAPALLIGAADAIKGKAGAVEIVAVLYEKVGALFISFDPAIDRIMCVTTERDALAEVMQVVRRTSTELMKASQEGS